MMMHAPHNLPLRREGRPPHRAHRTALALLAALAAIAGLGVAGNFTAPAAQASPDELTLHVDPAKPKFTIQMRHMTSENFAVLPEGAKGFRIEMPRQADTAGLHTVHAKFSRVGSDTEIEQSVPIQNGHIRIDLSQWPEPLSGEDFLLWLKPAHTIYPHEFHGFLNLKFTRPAAPAGKELIIQAAAEGRDPTCTVTVEIVTSWTTEEHSEAAGTPVRIKGGQAALRAFSNGSPTEALEINTRYGDPDTPEFMLRSEGEDLLFTTLRPESFDYDNSSYPPEIIISATKQFPPGRDRDPSAEAMIVTVPMGKPHPATLAGQNPDAKIVTPTNPSYEINVTGQDVPLSRSAQAATLYLPPEVKNIGLTDMNVTVTAPDGTMLGQQRVSVHDATSTLDFTGLPAPPDGQNYTVELSAAHDIAPHKFKGSLNLDFTREPGLREPVIDASWQHRDGESNRVAGAYVWVTYETAPVEVRPGDTVLVQNAIKIFDEHEAHAYRYVNLETNDPDADLISPGYEMDERDILVTIPADATSEVTNLLLARTSLLGNRLDTVRPNRSAIIIVPLTITP